MFALGPRQTLDAARMGNKISPRIWIDAAITHYESVNGSWQLPVSEIRVIGEHTNDHGPYGDDYFFVFLTDSYLYEASFYAEGRDQFLADLSHLLEVKISCGLVNSTDFQSRVMWPPDIEGQPFYNFVTVPKSEGFLAGVKHKLFPSVAYHLADSVRSKVAFGAEGRI